MDDIIYDRELLVKVIIYHCPTSTSGCYCGWRVLGASFAEHVADVYEEAQRAKWRFSNSL